MLHFDALFTRYDSKKAELRVSSPQPLTAESFADAYQRASDILAGLRSADPERGFDLHQLTGRQLPRATECNGARMFETLDELTERVAVKPTSCPPAAS